MPLLIALCSGRHDHSSAAGAKERTQRRTTEKTSPTASKLGPGHMTEISQFGCVSHAGTRFGPGSSHHLTSHLTLTSFLHTIQVFISLLSSLGTFGGYGSISLQGVWNKRLTKRLYLCRVNKYPQPVFPSRHLLHLTFADHCLSDFLRSLVFLSA